ncbi:filamentous hemagglutinin N-terminal domain-containing protein [Providencia sneebia]|uniref:Large exoprotein n=1 Tax=Providencia sneebia DSM 19967 TaxID=1141660 RepID=K8W0X5_9GAMM|nr:filamentous hemagglutinin N-terminal domain-containing protein [Providencia sneebia]EKT54198.1 large exoprotein [Providencia sneebia DSM 19967]
MKLLYITSLLLLTSHPILAQENPVLSKAKIIDISAPLENHISFNTFENLSSNEHGLIFNNDIKTNGNLGGKTAQLILAEVTGSEATKIQGILGIKGKMANLVIANPNGISWSNGSVSNINSLSLVAGNFEKQFIKDKQKPNKLLPKPLKDYSQLKFTVQPGSLVTIAQQQTQTAPIQLSKINVFADRIKLENAVNITAAVQNYLSTSGNASISIRDGLLNSGAKYKTDIPYLQGSHFELSKNGQLTGRSVTLESYQYQCKDSFMCPSNKIDIQGLIKTMSFSLQGNSHLSVTGKLALGLNQQVLTNETQHPK